MTETTIYTEQNLPVPCTYEVPDGAQVIAIISHGFGSDQESMMGQILLRDLPPAGIGALAFDFPAHGRGAAAQTDLRIEICLDHLQATEDFIRKTWPDARIVYFGSSFGAYVDLLYFSRRPFTGTHAFLRSAAVNMPELFLGGSQDKAEESAAGDATAENGDDAFRQALERNEYVTLEEGFPHPVKLPMAFFLDLLQGDLQQNFDPAVLSRLAITMVHGEKDGTIPVGKAKTFADAGGIPIRIFPGEDHTLSTFPQTPEAVVEDAIRFFRDEEK